VSGQTTLYQKLRVDEPVGAVMVWVIVLSPLVADVLPSWPE